MLGVYVFTAVFGWLLVAVFLFSGAEFGGDVDLDAGVDLDLDPDLDADAAADIGDTGNIGQLMGALVSFRSLVFFAAFFGLTGILLNLLDSGTVVTVIAAAGVGMFAAYVNGKLMTYLMRTSVSSQLRNSKIAGNTANVIVPIGPGSKGKVAVDVNGQRLYLVARSFNESHEAEFAVGDNVVIVEVDKGSALVARMDKLD